MFHVSLLLLIGIAASEPTTLSGMVVDGDGTPVAGAIVVVADGPTAFRFIAQSAPLLAPKAPDVLATGTSDEAGKFEIGMPDEVPEGAWRRTRLTVWAYHPDFVLAVRLMDRDWPRAGLPLVFTSSPTDSARLKITDEDWRPLSLACVAPARVAGQLVPAEITERLAADADAQGRAALRGVAPADLDLVVIEDKTHGVQWAGVSARGSEKIALVPLAVVGSLKGRLTADDPRAVRRRRLRFATWQIPSDERAGGGLAEVTTDDDGGFHVPAIAAGSLTFEVEGLGARGSGLEKDSQVPSPQSHVPPVYLAGETTGPAVEPKKTTIFEIRLRRAVTVTQEVRDHDGNPIAGVRVSMKLGLPGFVSGDTSKSGRLEVHLLPDRVVPMAVRIPAPYYYPFGIYSTESVTDGAETVSLKPMQLARGVTLRGRVVDKNQHPSVGAEVFGFCSKPTNSDDPIHAWTNASGEFAIEAVGADCAVRLWARHGELTNLQPVTVRPGGEPATLAIDGQSAVSLEGRVVDAGGQPIEGAVVRIDAEQQEFITGPETVLLGSLLFDGSDRLVTDSDGQFRTPRSLRPNVRYSLEVEAPGMAPAVTEYIEPDRWQTTRFADVVMRPSPRLRIVNGRVVDSQGREVAGATVWQSGDGPRRTETTTDDHGQFQLHGVYDAPAILLARKDGFRLQGTRVAATDKNCTIIIRRTDEPAAALTAVPPLVPMEEQRAIARSLIESLLPMFSDPMQTSLRGQLLTTIARVDPEKAQQIAETLNDPFLATIARGGAATSLATIDVDQALTTIAGLPTAYDRAHACLTAINNLDGAVAETKDTLLNAALDNARAESDLGSRAYLLGRIGARWFSLGERERGTALLREGQAVAESLAAPTAANEQSITMERRGWFAGLLALINGPAALRLIEGYTPAYYLYYYQTDVARGLADHDPAEAERVLSLVPSPPMWLTSRLPVLERMAAVDADRAARLARVFPGQCSQAFALGTVAFGLAAKNRTSAARLLDEAYELIERAHCQGPQTTVNEEPASTAAALLPVAERIDPMLVEGYLWRSLSLREPRSALGDRSWKEERLVAALAAMIARYDRDLARDLLQPLAGRFREAMAEAETDSTRAAQPVLMAMAVTDVRWAAELVEALPDAPQLTKSPKRIAARLLAEWLCLSPSETWRMLYDYCGWREPGTRDQER
jgi:protocatechuate 3,4-dioxygenase beta subunit